MPLKLSVIAFQAYKKTMAKPRKIYFIPTLRFTTLHVTPTDMVMILSGFWETLRLLQKLYPTRRPKKTRKIRFGNGRFT